MDGNESILIGDSDAARRKRLAQAFRDKGYRVVTARSGKEVLNRAKAGTFNAGILSASLPDTSGVELVGPLKGMQPNVEVIVLDNTDEATVLRMTDGMSARAARRLDVDEILGEVELLVDEQRQSLENGGRVHDKRGVEVVADVAECKGAEEALARSEAKFRSLVETSSAGVGIADLAGRFTFVNVALCRMLGYAEEQMVGTPFSEFVYPDDRERILEAYLKGLGGGRTRPLLEFRVVHRDGHTLWCRSTPAPLVANDEIIGFSAIVHDITDLKRTEDALRRSEEKYRNLVDYMYDGYLVVRGSKILFVNRVVADALGQPVEGTTGASYLQFLTPESLEKSMRIYERTKRGEPPPESEQFTLQRADGTTLPVELTFKEIEYEGERAYSVLVRDITERKQAEDALRYSEARFRELADLLPEVVYETDGLGRITYANRLAFETFGYSQREMEAGLTIADMIVPQERSRLAENLQRWFTGEEVGPVEYTAQSRSGVAFPMLVHASPVRDSEGRLVGARAVAVNIAERKKLEDETMRHARRVEALHSVAQTVSQAHDLQPLLDAVLVKLLEVTEADAGGIYLADATASRLVLQAHAGVSREYVASITELNLDPHEVARATGWEESGFDVDSVLEEAGRNEIASAIEQEGLRAYISLPFGSKGAPLGALVIASRQERQFSCDELDLVRAIGNEIGVGVENVRLLERTRELSVTDEMTGLYNRRYFYEALEKEIDRTRRYGRSFSVVMIDLDGFKEYNDRFGHINGDAVLKSMADTLKSSLRKSDMGFRYGGDEFNIILPATDAKKAADIIDRLRSRWLRVSKSENLILETSLGFSAGIAQYPEDAGTADGLVFLADTALFNSKREGGYRSTLVSQMGTVTLGVIDDAVLDHVYALAATVDAKDPYTYGHSERVAATCEAIGEEVGLSTEELLNLHAAALLHDVGKVGVPDSILTKPGPLTSGERDTVERHATEGARIVGHMRELAALVPIVRHHHEWYDGTGYPDALKGEDIPLGARIVAIADAYDTMTTVRPYRSKVSQAQALAELRRCAGTQFDPDLVAAFHRAIVERGRRLAQVRG